MGNKFEDIADDTPFYLYPYLSTNGTIKVSEKNSSKLLSPIQISLCKGHKYDDDS